MNGSLNQTGTRGKEKSKILRIELPRSNPNIKSDIDTELDNGWHIASCVSFINPPDTKTTLLYTLTKPKRN